MLDFHRISAIFQKTHKHRKFYNIRIWNKKCISIYYSCENDKIWYWKGNQANWEQVEVIKAFYHRDDEIIFQESAFTKWSRLHYLRRDIQNIIKYLNARIVTVNPEFFVIEKTGFRDDTEKLYKDLAPFGLFNLLDLEELQYKERWESQKF